jgi:hypothetical protein
LDKFQSNGLNTVLSGHIHFQNIRSYKKADDNVTYDIVTSALSVYPQQYGIFKYSPNSGYDYTTSQVNIEGWAKESGISDENLKSFKIYSKEGFSRNSYYMAHLELYWEDEYTKEQKDLMSKTFAELNVKHFDGTADRGMDKIRNSYGFKLFEKAPSDFFLRRLVMNLAYDGDIDNNNLHIPISNK